MQIPIWSGSSTDEGPDFRVEFPVNMVPVPLGTGISQVYLRPAPGIVQFGDDEGPGPDRGGISRDGILYRVMGEKLVSVAETGVISILGDVGPGGHVTMDYSFDLLAIWSGGRLYYWDGGTLTQVTDADLGDVIGGVWISGYFLSTDGESLIVTELDNPFSVNPLKYGSAESDPDPVMAVDKLRNELYALGRFTIEAYQNIGGTGFPFQRVDGAQVPKGVIGTHAYAAFIGTFAFVGSGRQEAPSVYLMSSGDTAKIATREIETLLLGYSEEQLSECIVEAQVDKAHQFLLIHLPDRTMVYDHAASKALGQSVWHIRVSSVVGFAQYQARNLVWCYDRWTCSDPTTNRLGALDDSISTHYGATIGWLVTAPIVYADGNDAIVHELELISLTGRILFGLEPVIWASHSMDGETWSQERSVRAGSQGQRNHRICWRTQGMIRHWRIQRFRGTSDAHVSLARLEAKIEPLFTR